MSWTQFTTPCVRIGIRYIASVNYMEIHLQFSQFSRCRFHISFILLLMIERLKDMLFPHLVMETAPGFG